MLTPLLVLAPLALQGGGLFLEKEEVGGAFGASLGCSAARLGDLDGDGVDDFAVGAYWEAHPPFSGPPGAVHVYSGATWDVLFDWYGSHSNQGFGFDVADAGDVNGDGVGDVLVGCWHSVYPGSAFVYSGADGTILHQLSGSVSDELLGESVSGLDDVDGDGFDDFLVGAPGSGAGGVDRAGAVFLHSGRSGAVLYRLDGRAYGDGFGKTLSKVEDLDGDGVRDILVGAPFGDPHFPNAPVKAGEVHLYSGVDGRELFRFTGQEPFGYFGISLSASGDLDGDGVADLAIGASGEDGGSGYYDFGAAYLYSGASRSLLRRIPGEQEFGSLGASLLITPDLNADGLDDLLLSQTGFNHLGIYGAGAVSLFAGGSGLELQRWHGPSYSSGFGSSLAYLGDPDADGSPDWLIGASGILSHGTHGAADGGFFGYGFLPLMSSDRKEISSHTGGTMHLALDFPSSEAGIPYRVLVSTSGTGPTWHSGAWIPLDQDGAFLRSLGGQAPPLLSGSGGVLDGQGNATAAFTVPAGLPSAAWHTTRWFSAATADPGTGNLRLVSVAVPLTLVP